MISVSQQIANGKAWLLKRFTTIKSSGYQNWFHITLHTCVPGITSSMVHIFGCHKNYLEDRVQPKQIPHFNIFGRIHSVMWFQTASCLSFQCSTLCTTRGMNTVVPVQHTRPPKVNLIKVFTKNYAPAGFFPQTSCTMEQETCPVLMTSAINWRVLSISTKLINN